MPPVPPPPTPPPACDLVLSPPLLAALLLDTIPSSPPRPKPTSASTVSDWGRTRRSSRLALGRSIRYSQMRDSTGVSSSWLVLSCVSLVFNRLLEGLHRMKNGATTIGLWLPATVVYAGVRRWLAHVRAPVLFSLQLPPFKSITDWMCFLLICALFMFEPSNPSPVEWDFVRLVSVPIAFGWDFIRLAAIPIHDVVILWLYGDVRISPVANAHPLPTSWWQWAGTTMWRDVELRRPKVRQSLLSGACLVLSFYTINWHHILLCKTP
jgi:hypothetical protein